MKRSRRLTILEEELNNFSLEKRMKALEEIRAFSLEIEDSRYDRQLKINLHAHTFFSFNAFGYSPSALAWIAKKNGLDFVGIVDFDVVDGVDEFLDACELLGIKGVAGVESRVFIPSYKAIEINSPGEPGIAYHMGTGITSTTLPQSIEDAFFSLCEQAANRNREIIEKLNRYLDPVLLSYDADILPLTPSGNATERHIVHKLVEKSFTALENPEVFWQEKLSLGVDEIENLLKNRIQFENTIRKKLIKRGGVAYVKPDPKRFPRLNEFNEIIEAASAIPCMAWLDGTSAGENDIEKYLGMMLERGVGAINIIPDRNWNIKDNVIKTRKLNELNNIVQLAEEWYIPILIGTEMNSYGQKFVDDLDVPELSDFRDSFLNGAEFIYGHTRLERLWDMGYQSDWAKKFFQSRAEKFSFYKEAGKIIPAGAVDKSLEKEISSALPPEKILHELRKRIESNGHI